MRKVQRILIMLTTMAGCAMGTTGTAGELDRGTLLAASCEGCHGPGGHSPGPIPDISTQSAEQLRTTLEEFRSGQRAATVMGRHVRGYTEEEVVLIAKYFESQD